MTNLTLDRLLELEILAAQGRLPDKFEPERQSLKSQLESKLAESDRRQEIMKILNKEDLAYNLLCENYWDCSRRGSFWKLQTRQEYDLETCHAIRDFIIELIKTGGVSIQSQHTNLVKAIQDRIKELEEESENYPLDRNDEDTRVWGELKAILEGRKYGV